MSKIAWAYKVTKAVELSYPPYQFTIEPTNACNLKCDFCPQSDPDHFQTRPKGRLTVENFKRFLQKIDDTGSSNRNINLTLDGEPFNNRDFLSILELATASGRFPVFATNATLLTKEKIDRMVAAGPLRASIDFASDRDIFESIRGQEGHFDLVKQNLLHLMELSRIHTGIHLDIHDISSFTGCDAAESLKKMRSLFPTDLPRRIRFDSRQFHNFCGHLDMEQKAERYKLCPYPWIQLAVTHNGDCVPCCRDTVGRSLLGNLFEQSIMEVWNGKRYREFRQNLIDRRPDLNSACKNCDLPYSGGQARWKPSYIYRSLVNR